MKKKFGTNLSKINGTPQLKKELLKQPQKGKKPVLSPFQDE